MTLTRASMAWVFAALLAFFLIVSLPMATAIGWSGLAARGFSARGASGSVWAGLAVDMAFGTVRLGDLKLSLSPLALFTGHAKFSFEPLGGDAAGARGALSAGSSDFALDHVSGRLRVDGLAPAGGTASFTLRDVSLRFASGRCTSASGGVAAEIGMADAMPGGRPLSFSGNAACEDGRFLLPLTGRSEAGDASLYIRIDGAGAYEYDFVLTAPGPALAAAGFTVDTGRARLHGAGNL